MISAKFIYLVMTSFVLTIILQQDRTELNDQQRQIIDEVLADTAMTRHILKEMVNRDAMQIQMVETLMEDRGAIELTNMCQMVMARDDEARSIILDQIDDEYPNPTIPPPPPPK